MKHAHWVAALGLLGAGAALAHEDCGCPDSHTHADWNWQPRAYAGAAPLLGHHTDDFVLQDGSLTTTSHDQTSTGYRVLAGLDFLGYMAVELGYSDPGEGSYAAQSDGSGWTWAPGPLALRWSVTGFDLSLVGKVPIYRELAAFLQVGAFRFESETSFSATVQSFGAVDGVWSDTGVGGLYGAGLQYDAFDALRARLAFSFYDYSGDEFIRNEAAVESVSLALAYLF